MELKQRKFAIGYLGITLLAILAFQLPLFGSQATNVSYSEFKALVRSGQVSEVAVGDSHIRGVLKKAEQGQQATFSTTSSLPRVTR